MRELHGVFAEASPLGAWVDTDALNYKTDRKTDKPKNMANLEVASSLILGLDYLNS